MHEAKNAKKGKNMKRSYVRAKVFLGTLLVFVGCSLLLAVTARAESEDERLVRLAWNASASAKCPDAIKLASECVEKFEHRALQLQSQLHDGKTPFPPVGTVSKEKKEEIFRMGLINNVGAALFIIADCERRGGNKEKAKTAYLRLAKLSYARVYDPSWNGFWAPAEEAVSMLKRL
jgi:hypothetical protein